jgi:hypothetical protein
LSLDPEALRARFRAARTGQQLNLLRLQLSDEEARALMKDPELSHLEKSTASLAKAFRGPIPRPFNIWGMDSHIIDADEELPLDH